MTDTERTDKSDVLLRQIFSGAASTLLSEALVVPAGLIIVAFLSRKLGPQQFGLFVLATSFVLWVEWSIYSLYTRTSITMISGSVPATPIAAYIVKLRVVTGLISMLSVWILAVPIASLFHEAELTFYLKIYCVEIPFFSLSTAYRSILIGTGSFHKRAAISAAKWTVRTFLIVWLVAGGFSVTGAILGSILAGLCEALLCCFMVHVDWKFGNGIAFSDLLKYAAPFVVFAIAMRFFEKLDLFTVKVLGASAVQAGYYGAAQNLGLFPGLLGLSLSPLLLSTIHRQVKQGDMQTARSIAAESIRLSFLLFPVVTILAGSSSEIVHLILGNQFTAASPVFAVLVFGSFGVFFISVFSAILTAAERAAAPAWIAIGMIPAAFVLNVLFIPRYGLRGAAFATALTAVAGALANYRALKKVFDLPAGLTTIIRASILAILSYFPAHYWKTPGFLLIGKLAGLMAMNLGVYLVLNELEFRNSTKPRLQESDAI